MQDKIGTIEEGTIVTITDFGMFIELENFTQGLVKFEDMNLDEVINSSGQKVKLVKGKEEKKFSLGEKLNVKIVDLDITKGLIDFEIHEGNS